MDAINSSIYILPIDVIKIIVSELDHQSLYKVVELNKNFKKIAIEIASLNEIKRNNFIIENIIKDLSKVNQDTKEFIKIKLILEKTQQAFKINHQQFNSLNEVKSINKMIAFMIQDIILKKITGEAETAYPLNTELSEATNHPVFNSQLSQDILIELGELSMNYLSRKQIKEAEFVIHIIPPQDEERSSIVTSAFKALSDYYISQANFKKAVEIINLAPEEIRVEGLYFCMFNLCHQQASEDIQRVQELADMIPEKFTDYKQQALIMIETIQGKVKKKKSCLLY